MNILYDRVAAEVFHCLHEEIASTASRGHKLMARVQQLETEVPSIGKVMFRDIASSCLSYNEGVFTLKSYVLMAMKQML